MNTIPVGQLTAKHVKPGNLLAQANITSITSVATIGELPGYDLRVSIEDLTRSVIEIFDRYPDIPGVIIDDLAPAKILCRKDLLQLLSRPFGNELFLNRSLSSLIKNLNLKNFNLPEETRIEDAISKALARPQHEIYEPILVTARSGQQMIVDFHVLLMAETQLLEQANRFIRQQVETGHTLSHLMDIHEVLHQILDDLKKMVPYHYGSILLFDPKRGSDFPSTTVTTWPVPSSLIDPIYNNRVLAELIATRAPKYFINIPITEYGVEETQDYPIDSWIGFPFVYSDQVLGLLSLVRIKSTPYREEDGTQQTQVEPFGKSDADLIKSLSATFTAAIRNAQLLGELHTLSETDPLTNTLNRRGFFTRATKWMHDAKKDTQCSILILDIDHFKRVNDLHGHQIGDVIIQKVAAECQRQLRQADLFGRYGGEEFIILLPDTDTNGAWFVAERLRLRIAEQEIVVGFQTIHVSVSIGGATFKSNGRALDGYLQQADKSLYEAKNNGRNCIRMWEQGLAETASPPASSSILQQAKPGGKTGSGLHAAYFDIASLIRKEDLENESVLGLVQALELREKEDRGHAQRVADMTLKLACLAGLSNSTIPIIYRGALLHDIGKIAIPDQILLKPGRLDTEEWEIMRAHPAYAYQLLSSFSYLKDCLDIPYCHHEKWDGSGYPRGLKGTEIPLSARLFAIVDVWVALTTNRCYRDAWPEEQVINHIQDQSGRHFDPDVVDLFLRNLNELTPKREENVS